MRAWPAGVLCASMALGVAAPALAQDQDEAREEIARLCLDHAQTEVRANGGEDVELGRVVDLDIQDERAVMQAEISADYSGDQRSGRVECEVALEGDNRVVAFRQVDEDEEDGGVFGGILGDDGGLDRDDSLTPDRGEQAADLCLDYAKEQVRDSGGDDVRMERVVGADVEGDRVLVEADMSAEYADGDRSARVQCEVDFEGDNRVVAFRQSEADGGAFDDLLGDILGNQ